MLGKSIFMDTLMAITGNNHPFKLWTSFMAPNGALLPVEQKKSFTSVENHFENGFDAL